LLIRNLAEDDVLSVEPARDLVSGRWRAWQRGPAHLVTTVVMKNCEPLLETTSACDIPARVGLLTCSGRHSPWTAGPAWCA
jgi:hypothetical protein